MNINEAFHTLKVYDGIEAELYPADESKVVVTGIDNEEVEAEVEDGVLKIKMGLGNVFSKNNTLVEVYFKQIRAIDANGGAVVSVMDKLKQASLNIRAQEGSDIVAAVDVTQIALKCLSGSKIEVKGVAENSEIHVRTGGVVDAEDLKTENTSANITAGGLAEIFATEYARAEVKLGGTIEIYGNPDKIDRKTTLGGKIIKR